MRLHESLTQRFTEDIVLGVVAPAAKLPREVDLQQQLGVSRGVVRETMRALEVRGLVAVTHGRGAYVLPEPSWDLLDATVLAAYLMRPDGAELAREVLDCRRSLEGRAAAQAAERATGADVRALEAAHELVAETAGAQPWRSATEEAFAAAEAGFHRAVVALAGNRPLAQMLEPLHGALAAAVRRQPQERRSELAAQHGRLLDAVRARDGAAARA